MTANTSTTTGRDVGETRVAMVTGASRGLGRAVAVDLARDGTSVLVVTRNRVDDAAATAAEVERAGGVAKVLQADVADAASIERLFRDARQLFDRLDVLVNNAGITADAHAALMGERKWDDVLDVNLKGAFLCAKHALRWMRAHRSGSIVNIASVSGLRGVPGQANYAASKAGLVGLTKTLAVEAAPDGIRVNAVAPGILEGGLSRRMPPEVRRRSLEYVPLRRPGTFREVAQVVSFVASEAASYVTGAVITVDGGLSS